MLRGEKILVTGVTGVVAGDIARNLAADNEVWGMARLADPTQRDALTAQGIRPVAVDFGNPDFSDTPDDFTYVLHFAWMRGTLAQQDHAMRVNVQGPGLLLQHCRKAKGALIVSSQGVYAPDPDPLHHYTESDPVGRAFSAYAQTSPACKLGLESVARFCAEAFDLPVTIARLNTVLGPLNAYHGVHAAKILRGEPIIVPHDPNLHSPICHEDMIWQVEPLVKSASRHALVTNWCGDEVISTQETTALLGEWSGVTARTEVVTVPGAPAGNPNDAARRLSITGPSRVKVRDALRVVHGKVTAAVAAAGES